MQPDPQPPKLDIAPAIPPHQDSVVVFEDEDYMLRESLSSDELRLISIWLKGASMASSVEVQRWAAAQASKLRQLARVRVAAEEHPKDERGHSPEVR